MLDIVDYENQIVDLEGKLKKAKNRKEIIVDRIKYVEVTNDTIKDLMLLNQINDTIIRSLEMIGTVKDSIIRNQQLVIQNDTVAIDALKSKIEEYRSIIMQQNKEVISERRKKTF